MEGDDALEDWMEENFSKFIKYNPRIKLQHRQLIIWKELKSKRIGCSLNGIYSTSELSCCFWWVSVSAYGRTPSSTTMNKLGGLHLSSVCYFWITWFVISSSAFGLVLNLPNTGASIMTLNLVSYTRRTRRHNDHIIIKNVAVS